MCFSLFTYTQERLLIETPKLNGPSCILFVQKRPLFLQLQIRTSKTCFTILSISFNKSHLAFWRYCSGHANAWPNPPYLFKHISLLSPSLIFTSFVDTLVILLLTYCKNFFVVHIQVS